MPMTSSDSVRPCLLLMSCVMCLGQTVGEAPVHADIVVPVNIVVAPTTVLDKSGSYLSGLTVENFMLFDNGKPQTIGVDVSFHPISMVVAVQASAMMDDVLPKIQKMGNVLDSLVLGQQGEAAVLAFDHRIQKLQDFTSDPGKIAEAMKKLKPGSSSHCLNDTVSEAIRMLKKRPEDHRRVLLLISETRDSGSEAHVREVLTEAQFANIVIYSIDISHVFTQLTGKAVPPRPDPIPATAQHLPGGYANTPTTMSQAHDLGNVIPAFVEIFKAGRGFFVSSSADVFTRFTGGQQYTFVTQRSLERSVIELGEELHSLYLLSYHPDDLKEAGFHDIRVEVNRPGLQIRTRPGYWVAGQTP